MASAVAAGGESAVDMPETVFQDAGARQRPHLRPPASSALPGRIPDFLIIGAAKAGTSALYEYLARHPQVAVSREKELNFFLDPGVLPDDVRGFSRGAWHLGVDWYRRWFQTDRPVCGEASPNYSHGVHAERVAARIAAVAPRARLIYLVRNPLSRARSHFLMSLKRPGGGRLSFAEYLATSNALAYASYGTVMEAYLRHFPREQIMVLESADLHARRRETMAKVFRFLGVDDRFWCSWYGRQVFVGSRCPCVSPRGARLRDSAPVQFLRSRLSPAVFYHVENLLLSPFRVPEPALEVPPGHAADVVSRLQREVDLLRRLTALELPSLDVTAEQAASPPHAQDDLRHALSPHRALEVEPPCRSLPG